MKSYFFSFLLFLSLISGGINAQDALLIHRNDGVTIETPITSTDSITFSKDGTTAYFHLPSLIKEMAVSEIDSLTFAEEQGYVSVDWSANGVKVINPYAFTGGVEISVSDGQVTVNSTSSSEIEYKLSGEGYGSFKAYSSKKLKLSLSSLTLTSTDGPAINIQSKKSTTIEIESGTSSLTDGTIYTACGTEDMKGTVFSEGQIIFQGSGELKVKGNTKHAICSDDYLSIQSGTISIESAEGDGLHANDYFRMDGGSLTVKGTTGDCIDAGEGYALINAGEIKLNVPTADTKGIKADSTIFINNGTIDITVSSAQSKGIKSGQSIRVAGGTIVCSLTGNAAIVSNEPSYCTAIKSDSVFTQTGGNITITHTGTAGKGISSDIATYIYGGSINITTSGSGGTYTNSSNQSDTYAATCIKSDGNIYIEDGTLTLKSTGAGGKGLVADGTLTIGSATHAPTISSVTTGSALTQTGSSGGFNPGGNRPGQGTSSTSGGKPKAIKAVGNITIDNGNISVSTAADGGEGIESKATLTINGGTIEAETYDDGINAGTSIVVNGGNIYAYASNNDGIDSNGTITITGGVIVSSGTTAPEEGIDCDSNTFKITGGTLIGVGGATSSPTSSVTTQRCLKYTSSNASVNTVYTICKTSDGSHVASFKMPRTYSSLVMLFSSALLSASTSYTIYTGGTATGGTTFHGLTTGATFSGGTKKTTFTTNSILTSAQ